MSGTDPGIRDILERMDGTEPPPKLLSDDPARDADAEAVAEQLRRSAEAATRRARQAEQSAANERHQRQQAQQELYRTRQARDDTEYNSITTAYAERESEADRLRAEVRQRADEGDHGRIAEINLRLGEIGGDLRDLRQGKAAFESYRQQALRAPEPQPEPPAGTTVGVSREAFMNGDPRRGIQGRTEATKAWLREHDEFFTDPKVLKRVTAADMLADAEGIRLDTPEYFKFVEEQAGMRTPQPRSSSRNGSDIYVSPEDRRAAEWMLKGMPGGYSAKDAEAYAIERAELKRKGQFPMRRR